MDRDLIESKLESLRRCVERIAAKTPASSEQLQRDLDLQDVIASRSLESVKGDVADILNFR